MINEQLWLGHFDLWSEEDIVMFPPRPIASPAARRPANLQCSTIVNAALAACEKHYQAFQFVLWAGRGAKESLELAMFETHGNA